MLSTKERNLLRRMYDSPSPSMLDIELLNTMKDRKLVRKLMSEGYVDKVEVQDTMCIGTFATYNLTAKAYSEFRPWWQKGWSFFTNDMAKIISIVAIVISILVGLKQIGIL